MNTVAPLVARVGTWTARAALSTVVLGIAVAAILLGSLVTPARWSAQASAAADFCPTTEVVFARGTGEPDGIGRVGQAFVDALHQQIGDRSLSVHAVDYPASRDFLRAVEGANEASAYVQQLAATCPTTKIVLGGYSQGAAVVDMITVLDQPFFGFTNIMPAEVADHVAAVAVFGNPANRVKGPLTALSPLYGAKTIDLCNGGDPVCSNGSDVPAHSLYGEAGLAAQAADFAARQLLAPAATVQQTAGETADAELPLGN
jgi:cutinase